MTSKLTLEQAIQHTDEKAAALSGPCAEQHKQLAEWLRELQERRKAERQADELTMWIKRLVRSLKNANPDSKLPRDAMDYLTAKGLISVGDILR